MRSATSACVILIGPTVSSCRARAARSSSTLDDIMEYDLDCNPIDQRGRPMYFERPIHGAIYQARPDVISIVHNHAYEVFRSD